VHYDGLTLAPTQAHAANQTATGRGIASRARFFVGSYEDPLPSAAYSIVLAIESLEHASDIRRSLAHLGRALHPGGTLVIVTDLLVDENARDAAVTVAYRQHWCGPHTVSWSPPASMQGWQVAFDEAQLRLDRRVDLTSKLFQRPRWGLRLYFEGLLRLHRLASWVGMSGLAIQASTQIGGVARELLLHEGTIAYCFMVARRADSLAGLDASARSDSLSSAP